MKETDDSNSSAKLTRLVNANEVWCDPGKDVVGEVTEWILLARGPSPLVDRRCGTIESSNSGRSRWQRKSLTRSLCSRFRFGKMEALCRVSR